MLSSAKMGVASWRYYQREVAAGPAEYFLARGEAAGRWTGRGLGELGLVEDGLVAERELEALLARGLHPLTGQALGRAWRTDGVTGYDLTFSAPKSVSALWAIGDPQVATQIAEAHRAAVNAALHYLDDHAAVSRKGVDGITPISTAGFAAAVFDHRTSRAGDPQLHSHALLVNKLRCADGVWRTIDGHEIYHHKKAAGAIYQAGLRGELAMRLGVGFGPANEHGQAEIAGVSTDLMRMWSKRAEQIEADAAPALASFAAALGRDLTPAERAKVVKTSVLRTRARKTHTDHATVQATWRAEAAHLGWTPRALLRSVLDAGRRARPARRRGLRRSRVDTGRPHPALEPADLAGVIDGALTAAGTRAATFSRAGLTIQVAAAVPAGPATAEETRDDVETATAVALDTARAVHVGQVQEGCTPRASDPRWATAELLATEARILGVARAGTGDGRGLVPDRLARASATTAGLDDEQTAVVRTLVGDGQLLSVLIAPAGAGKTTTIGAAAAAWTAAGYQVLGLAPSARAAAELAAATGGHADTVAKWRHEQARDYPEGQAHWRAGPRTVLLVDEAGMLATTDLHALTEATQAGGGKLVLVGDPAQIGPVAQAGGLLPTLAGRVGGLELTGIHRFTQPWEAQATRALRAGQPAVWHRYAANDRIHPAADTDTALDAVHVQWAQATAHGSDALMMARARTDVDALNQRARAAALETGDVHGPVLATAGGRTWQAGDLLRARRNDRRLALADGHVRNGDRFRVIGPGIDGGLLVDDLTGRGRALLPGDYLAAHADYGWASTIDGAQGATADIGILLARPGLDREHLYVGMTRGRHENHVHLTVAPPDTDGHRPRPAGTTPTIHEALSTLQTITTRVGAEPSAHTLLDQAREHAREQAWARTASSRDMITAPTNPVRRRQAWASPNRLRSMGDPALEQAGRVIER